MKANQKVHLTHKNHINNVGNLNIAQNLSQLFNKKTAQTN